MEGGYVPPSLNLEGFIHCSYPDQVSATGKRYFKGQTDLVLLWIDPARLIHRLIIENAPGQTEKFPHIYGSLNLGAVVKVTDFNPDAV